MTDEGYVHDSGALSEEDPRPQSEYDEAAARAENREFDWHGWVLVGMVILAFFVAPGVIYAVPYAGGTITALGLTWRDTYLTVPFVPALVLGLTAIWATARA